ncbi:MAG: hypothetical protein L3J45_09525 [Flavobacteriaceae bacterium]|nr:hypothetical protein [Flavobacteriaceae bacterium]
MNLKKLENKIVNILADKLSTSVKLQSICNKLKHDISYYDWVGFYFKNGSKNELKLGPFAGEATEHTLIPFGKGICGQVAVSNENFVVQDVTAQDNYISRPLHNHLFLFSVLFSFFQFKFYDFF